MNEPEHPKRIVSIEGEQAHVYLNQVFRPTPSSFRFVKDADDFDREKEDPGDNHQCPLCKETFFWEAFKAHAPLCIVKLREGRLHIFGSDRTGGRTEKTKMTRGDRTGYPVKSTSIQGATASASAEVLPRKGA